MTYLFKQNVFFLLIMLFSVKVWAQNPDSNAYTLRGKVIHKMERTPIENAQVILHLNENETIGAYTDELGDFELHFSLEKYPLEKTQLAVMQGFETALFSPKDFEGKNLMICELGTEKSEIVCLDVKLAPFVDEIEQVPSEYISDEVSTISVCTRRFIPQSMFKSCSHRYTMKDIILNNSDVYLVK